MSCVETPESAMILGIRGVQHKAFTKLVSTEAKVRRLDEEAHILKAYRFKTITRPKRKPNATANASCVGVMNLIAYCEINTPSGREGRRYM
jgi:hypothetical protein